ncbi:MAG: pyridoxal phosphate-dependent aminotransferase [Methylothermaceae bacterium]|nr:pyridoxal phosphate-dependent aminotransferase [Methylothermaceae bacterium]
MQPYLTRLESIQPFIVMELLARARALEAQGASVVHMEIGEPDFPTPDPIAQAGMETIANGRVRYTPAAGLPQLREAIAAFYRQRYGIRVAPERVFLTPGASGAFLLALSLLLESGKRVLMTDPGYPCNRHFVHLFGGVPDAVPVTADTRFHLTETLVREYWRPETVGVWLASPANPTGTVIDPDELARICRAVASKNGFLISDEIYHGLEYHDGRCVSALEVAERVLVVNSFSKYFGMTGWRLGWLVVPEALIDAAERVAQNIFISAPTHSQYAALAAFEPRTLDILEERRRRFEDRRDFLYDALCSLGFKVGGKPRGAFYLYADCSAFTDDSYRFALALLDRAGVAVTPGCDFGRARASAYVRFAYTVELEALREGVERIAAFLDRDV